MEEAEEYLRGKPPFKYFDPDCLRNYLQYSTTTSENGLRLTFDINVESEIYRTVPHNIGSYKRVLGIPGTIIIGKDTYRQSGYMLSRFARRQGFDFERLSYGSHLFPLEYPEQTAALIRKAIAKPNRSIVQ